MLYVQNQKIGTSNEPHPLSVSGVCVAQSLVFCVEFCRSSVCLFLSFYYLSFLELRSLISPLVSANFLDIGNLFLSCSNVRVAQILVFCVVFVDHYLYFRPSCGHCPSFVFYGF